MNWKPIKEEPKQKNRHIMIAQYWEKNKTFLQEYIGDSWDDCVHFRLQGYHSFTHWCYVTTPKN